MATETLEERVASLEDRLASVQEQLNQRTMTSGEKRGWQWFVGVYSDNPYFEDAVRLGNEWRNSDRPLDREGDSE